jgi:hypothetical protein
VAAPDIRTYYVRLTKFVSLADMAPREGNEAALASPSRCFG